MVVKRKKYFFEYHSFEKRGRGNLDGGAFLKKVWREALFATPRPVLGHPPLPRRGGWGPPENSGVEIYATTTSSPVPMVQPNLFR